MNEVMIFWLVLLICCIVIEALTMGLTTIWFAGGALIAILAALLQAPIFVQVILFFLVSLLLLFFTRPLAVKYFNKDRVKTNVESMVGRQAIVVGDIDNVQCVGQVTVAGQEWSARSCDDGVRIPAGAVVRVAAVSGVKLIVKADSSLIVKADNSLIVKADSSLIDKADNSLIAKADSASIVKADNASVAKPDSSPDEKADSLMGQS